VLAGLRAFYRDEAFLLELLARFDWEPADPEVERRRMQLQPAASQVWF
jgi:hypothetical protein